MELKEDMESWSLSREGYVMQYMLAGPVLEPYYADGGGGDQLEREGQLRKKISDRKPDRLIEKYPSTERESEIPRIRAGEKASIGDRWKVYAPYGSCFVDVSAFYSTLKKIRLEAATVLIAGRKMRLRARLWTYMAVGVYLNGRRIAELPHAVYKPMQSLDMELNLKEGRNSLHFLCENLGVRDTRNIFGLQILGELKDEKALDMESTAEKDYSVFSELRVGLLDESLEGKAFKASRFLEGCALKEGRLIFPEAAASGAELYTLTESPDYYRDKEEKRLPLAGRREVKVPEGSSIAHLRIRGERFSLERRFECTERVKPEGLFEEELPEVEQTKRGRQEFYRRLGEVRSLERGGFGFGIMGVLARSYLRRENPEAYRRLMDKQYNAMTEEEKEAVRNMQAGRSWRHDLAVSEENRIPSEAREHIAWTAEKEEEFGLAAADRKLLFDDLDCIEERVDCADFLLCGFLRYLKNYPIDAELNARIEEVFLHFRYWMDEKGTDAMCFWSENHSLMFYASAMFAGELYPDKLFVRAGLRGRELSALGKSRVLDWLKDVERYGFEEFLSHVYTSVTMAVLLNLVDYGDEEVSRLTKGICDAMLEALFRHSFHASIIAPMGRAYRNVLYPFSGATQSILNLVNPVAPYSFGEGWMSYMATSSYQIPEKAMKSMNSDYDGSYVSGNARIMLKKTEDYLLSSVQSPRKDGERWENIRLGIPESAEKSLTGEEKLRERENTVLYTKALNESFHGTSEFTPGTYGYQQHLWTAALSGDAILFLNHPGSSSEESGMRPGYWHGNSLMPALKQEGKLLGMIYSIPDKNPIHFVHAYLPKKRFDEVVFKGYEENLGEWVFMRKNRGYMALWCSERLSPWNQELFDCELRIYNSRIGAAVIMGSEAEYGSFSAFQETVSALMPRFDREKQRLLIGDYSLEWKSGEDKTQYIE